MRPFFQNQGVKRRNSGAIARFFNSDIDKMGSSKWVTIKCAGYKCMYRLIFILFTVLIIFSCSDPSPRDKSTSTKAQTQAETTSYEGHDLFIQKYLEEIKSIPVAEDSSSATDMMVMIPGNVFEMGGDNEQALPDEYPKHKVKIDSFYMDIAEVTNKEYKDFTQATGYKTIAERDIDPQELLAQLPPGTTLPPDFDTSPISLVFSALEKSIPAHPGNWWRPTRNANWQQPEGDGSSIEGKDNYPAVHIAWIDAMAYCKWKGKRLPTEAEWEYAARGSKEKEVYHWGNEPISDKRANYWQGEFPYENTVTDKFNKLAPVKSFPPNGFSLYDISGNVWEWCSDWYQYDLYKTRSNDLVENPTGPRKSFDPLEPSVPKKVMRGGSFLCNDSYCSGYRVAARMKSSPDTGLEHTGCRCARSL